jgi:hypothetical protein
MADVLLVGKDEEEPTLNAVDETADVGACGRVDDHRRAARTNEHRAVPLCGKGRVERDVAVATGQSSENSGERRGASMGEHRGQRRFRIAGVVQEHRRDNPRATRKLPERERPAVDLER